jgi:hypothetical protein
MEAVHLVILRDSKTKGSEYRNLAFLPYLLRCRRIDLMIGSNAASSRGVKCQSVASVEPSSVVLMSIGGV